MYDKSDKLAFEQGAVIIPDLLKSLRVERVEQISYFGRTTDFTQFIQRVTDSSFDGFVVHASAIDSYNIVRQLRSRFRGPIYLMQPPYRQLEARTFDSPVGGLYFASSFWLDPRSRESLTILRSNRGSEGGIVTPVAGGFYDVVRALAELAPRGKPKQGEEIRAAFRSQTFQGIGGSFRYGHDQIIQREPKLIAVQGGEYKLVSKRR